MQEIQKEFIEWYWKLGFTPTSETILTKHLEHIINRHSDQYRNKAPTPGPSTLRKLTKSAYKAFGLAIDFLKGKLDKPQNLTTQQSDIIYHVHEGIEDTNETIKRNPKVKVIPPTSQKNDPKGHLGIKERWKRQTPPKMATTTQRQKTTTEYDENFAKMIDKIMKANLDYQ